MLSFSDPAAFVAEPPFDYCECRPASENGSPYHRYAGATLIRDRKRASWIRADDRNSGLRWVLDDFGMLYGVFDPEPYEPLAFVTPEIVELDPIPANSNPFHYDLFHMGSELVRGWEVMHPGFDRPESPLPLDYVILINKRSGQRIRINLNRPQD